MSVSQPHALIDSTVLVDLLRKHPPAHAWLAAKPASSIGTTNISWMELIYGAQNKLAQQQCLQVVGIFPLVYLTQEDMTWAMEQLLKYRLRHSVGVGDCLIASVSHRLQVPLYTHNLKHLSPLLGDLAVRPY